MPERPRARLEAADEDPEAARVPVLKRLMESVLHRDETAYLTRRVVSWRSSRISSSAGCSVSVAAVHAPGSVGCGCVHLQLGSRMLARALAPRDLAKSIVGKRARHGHASQRRFLVDHDLVTAFEAGWSVLYEDVSLFVADQLASTAADLHGVDTDTRRGLRRAAAHARGAAQGRHTMARARRCRRARDARHDRLGQRPRIAGRVSHPARGADSHSRRPHHARQPDRVSRSSRQPPRSATFASS